MTFLFCTPCSIVPWTQSFIEICTLSRTGASFQRSAFTAHSARGVLLQNSYKCRSDADILQNLCLSFRPFLVFTYVWIYFLEIIVLKNSIILSCRRFELSCRLSGFCPEYLQIMTWICLRQLLTSFIDFSMWSVCISPTILQAIFVQYTIKSTWGRFPLSTSSTK